MNQEFKHLAIEAIASCIPPSRITNDSFDNLLVGKELKFFEKTVGIIERRWVEDNVTASDLGFKASERLMSELAYPKEKIKALIFLSQTSDYKIPFTSNILQSRLGLGSDTLCLDINAGCAGFIQGLSVSFSIAGSLKDDEKVLFIVGETLSKILSKNDRSTTMLFGDAASAIIIGKSELENLTFLNSFSDGINYDAIMIEDGGYRNCFSSESLNPKIDSNNNSRAKVDLAMDGPRVFDFTLREVAPSIQKLLNKNDLNIQDIDYFLFHQSNRFIIKQISSKLGIDESKVLINIEQFGNTSGVSIPLLITTFSESFSNVNKVLFSGYGSGLNWGNCVTSLNNTKILPNIEY